MLMVQTDNITSARGGAIMNSQTYNQVVLELAIAGLADLTASAQTKKPNAHLRRKAIFCVIGWSNP